MGVFVVSNSWGEQLPLLVQTSSSRYANMTAMFSPPDTGHRFAPITAENASGHLWISSILCLIYCSLVLVVRLHIKWNLYGADDATVTVATVVMSGSVSQPEFVSLSAAPIC